MFWVVRDCSARAVQRQHICMLAYNSGMLSAWWHKPHHDHSSAIWCRSWSISHALSQLKRLIRNVLHGFSIFSKSADNESFQTNLGSLLLCDDTTCWWYTYAVEADFQSLTRWCMSSPGGGECNNLPSHLRYYTVPKSYLIDYSCVTLHTLSYLLCINHQCHLDAPARKLQLVTYL